MTRTGMLHPFQNLVKKFESPKMSTKRQLKFVRLLTYIPFTKKVHELRLEYQLLCSTMFYMCIITQKIYGLLPQCARTDLNKRFLPKPMTTTG